MLKSTTAMTAPATAPTKDTQTALAGAFVALMAANNAIIRSPQFPTTTIKGLENANATLATAVKNATYWNKTLSANVQNQLQLIVNYNDMYGALVDSIEGYIRTLKNTAPGATPPAGTLSNLSAEIAALQQQVQGLLYGASGTKDKPADDSALGVYNDLTSYQSAVAADESAFATLMNIANSDSTGIPAEIKRYQDAITADNSAISKDQAMIAGGAAAIVTGVLICVVAVALAPETGGSTLLVAGAVGVAAIGGGAAMIGVASHDLDKKIKDITEKQKEIKEDQQELALLTTMSKHAGDLATQTKSVVEAMSTVQTSWQQLDNAMSDMVSALNAPENELMDWVKTHAPDQDPSYMVLGTILDAQMVAPKDDWKTASDLAGTILKNLQNVILLELPKNTTPTQDAIAKAAAPHLNAA